jgi:hypothetical protein
MNNPSNLELMNMVIDLNQEIHLEENKNSPGNELVLDIQEIEETEEKAPKVFFMGFPKTGSYSFYYYFDKITNKRIHDHKIILEKVNYQRQWGQKMGKRLNLTPHEFSKELESSIDMGEFDKILEENDIFTDFPFPLLYDYIATKYPDAYFVHSYRNPTEWYQSMTLYFGSDLKTEKNNIFEAVFGSQVPGRLRKQYLEKYIQWNQAIKNYFSKEHPNLHFLSFDLSISDEEKTTLLKDFLPQEIIPSMLFPVKHFTKLKKHCYRNLSFQKFNFNDRIMDKMEFIDIDFRKAQLTNTFFKTCLILRCNFRQVDLSSVQFENCEVRECLFDDLMPPLNMYIRVTYDKLEKIVQDAVDKAIKKIEKK